MSLGDRHGRSAFLTTAAVRFEMLRHRAVERGHRGRERCILAHAGPHLRQHLCACAGQIDAGQRTSLTTVRPATINSRILQAVARVSANSNASISSRWRSSLIAAQSSRRVSVGTPVAIVPPSSTLVTEDRPLANAISSICLRLTAALKPVPA